LAIALSNWLLVIGALGSLTAACVNRLPDQDLRILSAVPDTKLSVDLLWKEFQSNADQARRTYFGKVVVISGTATRVGDDVPTDRYVFFAQSGELGVRANLLDEQAADILTRTKEEPRTALKCFCEGLDGNLLLKSCVRP
jgi:hypothetical protein